MYLGHVLDDDHMVGVLVLAVQNAVGTHLGVGLGVGLALELELD